MGDTPPPKAKDIETSTPKNRKEPDEGFKSVEDELGGLKGSLRRVKGLRVMDPDLTANIETSNSAAAPAASPQANAPDRLTLIVPHHDTKLSLGKGEKERIPEDGITGQTEAHVHWQVTKTCGDHTKTIVTLGGPVKKSSAVAGVEGVPAKSNGYAMVTEGKGWHESKGSHFVTASEGDLVLRSLKGKHAVLQAESGKVEVGGATGVVLGGKSAVAISAYGGFDVETTGYDKDPTGMSSAGAVAAGLNAGINIAVAIASTDKLVKAFDAVSRSAKKGSVAWSDEENKDVLKGVIGSGDILFAATRARDAWKGDVFSGAGKISIASGAYFSASGDIAATLFGATYANVASLQSASIVSSNSSVKGLGYSTLWAGREASVRSLGSVSVGAKTEVYVRGKKGVEVSSGAAVTVQANDTARLSSVSGTAYVFGKNGAYLGAAAAGFGVKATETTLHVGRISGGADQLQPSPEPRQGLWMSSGKPTKITQLVNEDAAIVMLQDKITMSATTKCVVEVLSTGVVNINGDKVHIG